MIPLPMMTPVIPFTRYKKPSFEGKALEKQNDISNSYFSEEKFAEINQYLKEESETTSMMVLENGKGVYEYGDVSEVYNIKDAETGGIRSDGRGIRSLQRTWPWNGRRNLSTES